MAVIEFIVSHYILMILLLVATTVDFVRLFLNKKALKMNALIAIIFSIFHTIIGLIFVAFFGFAESGFNIATLGNISLYGGVFFMPIVYFLYSVIRKIPISRSFDIFTISLISTLFFARINCLISGCCQGILIGNTNFRVPTRELELLFYLIFIILTADKIYKNKTNGYIYPIYMLSYGIFRFIIEFMRESSANSVFHIGHIWSIISILVGCTALFLCWRLRGKSNEKIIKENI